MKFYYLDHGQARYLNPRTDYSWSDAIYSSKLTLLVRMGSTLDCLEGHRLPGQNRHFWRRLTWLCMLDVPSCARAPCCSRLTSRWNFTSVPEEFYFFDVLFMQSGQGSKLPIHYCFDTVMGVRASRISRIILIFEFTIKRSINPHGLQIIEPHSCCGSMSVTTSIERESYEKPRLCSPSL